MRTVLALLASAALLAVCAAQQPSDCDISDPHGLSRCIKQLLINSRGKIAKESDPLRLPNHKDGDLKASNIVIRGIAGYSVDNLSVTFPRDQQIAVRATISWPHIRGDLDVEFRKCKRIIFNICSSVSASPHVEVPHTVGTLTAILNIGLSPEGKLTVRVSGTNVVLYLASIDVHANTHGFLGAVNRLVGDPASRITTELANKWWDDNKDGIQDEARDALNEAFGEDLSLHLGQLLTV